MQLTNTVKHLKATMQDIQNEAQLAQNLQNLVPAINTATAADVAEEIRYQILACGETTINYTVNAELSLVILVVAK